MSSKPEEKPIFSATSYSPVNQGGIDHDDGVSVGGCFGRFCCFGSNVNRESNNYLLRDGQKEAWIVVQVKKVKEFSEVVAGPKWKNFIRKVGKLFNPKNRLQQTTQQFQYSPESYALNFAGDQYYDDDEEDDVLSHSFSSRFAAAPLINKDQGRMSTS